MLVNTFLFKQKVLSSGSRLAVRSFPLQMQSSSIAAPRAGLEVSFPAQTCLEKLLFYSVVDADCLLVRLKSPACGQVQILALAESNPEEDIEGTERSSGLQ